MAGELNSNFINLIEWLQLDRAYTIGASVDPDKDTILARQLPKLEDKKGEAEANDFSPENLAEWLNKEQLIIDWTSNLESRDEDGLVDIHVLQALQLQNDFMSACHRDLAIRFGSRIRRIIHEGGRRRGHGVEDGFVQQVFRRFHQYRARQRKLNEGGIE